MMNLIVGFAFVVLGTIFALWPRALWRLRWSGLLDREPTRIEEIFVRAAGAALAAMGLMLALSDYLYLIF